MSTKGLVILAVALGGLGMFLVHSSATPVETVDVVVVSQDLAAGSVLKVDFARKVKLPKPLAKRYCLWDEDSRMWQNQRLARPIGEGELVTPNHMKASSRVRIAEQLKPHERAATIAVGQGLDVGPFLSPGNRVDVLATSKDAEGGRTELLLEDVEVLAVGAWAERAFLDPVTLRASGPSALTLRLTAGQATQLAHAVATNVVLHVTLRPQTGAAKEPSADAAETVPDADD